MLKRLLLVAISLSLVACNQFFDSDNTPTPAMLTPITPEAKPHLVWSTKTGGGSNDDYLKLSPTLAGNAIYTTSANGIVTATNKATGQSLWSRNTHAPTSAGPGVGDGMVVIGSRSGNIIALHQDSGQLRWSTAITGEILAKPAIRHNIVIVKAVDGTVHALSAQDGHALWSYQQAEPNLILRGGSAPLFHDNALLVGFANGNLVKLSARNGQVDWLRNIATPTGAFSIQRMIDIDADPISDGQRIFVATYQGNITALDWHAGRTLWSHDISSYAGMTADNNTAYLSDAKSHVWAFNAASGSVNWRQTQLEARNISGPAVMGNYLVVGDSEGYLHWLSKRDGHIAAREFSGNAIIAAPIVENNVLYALTKNGSLVAYRLSS